MVLKIAERFTTKNKKQTTLVGCLFFYLNLLTTIFVDVIIHISANDTTEDDIVVENIVLTEAVYYILLSLFEHMHGYGIMQNVEKLSSGRVRLAAGTLYGAINTLLEKHWIEALPEEKNSRKKEYIITSDGKEAVNYEIKRLRELLENGEKIVGGV